MAVSQRITPPLLLPRGLILASSAWLVLSWILCIGLRTPVQPSAASYTPGVRMMLLSVTVGLLIGWPMLRLSQRATAWPVQQTLLDLVVLLSLVQVVIWPLRLVTPWSAERTAAIDATLVAWAIFSGAILASAVGTSRAGVRNLAMLACLAVCLIGPAVAWLGLVGGFNAAALAAYSPLLAVNLLSGEGPSLLHEHTWAWLAFLGGTGVLVWIALTLALAATKR